MKYDINQYLMQLFVARAVEDTERAEQNAAIIVNAWLINAQEFIRQQGLKHKEGRLICVRLLDGRFPIYPPADFYIPQGTDYYDRVPDVIDSIVQVLYILYGNGHNVYSVPFDSVKADALELAHYSLPNGFSKCSYLMQQIPRLAHQLKSITEPVNESLFFTASVLGSYHIEMSVEQAHSMASALAILDLKRLETLDADRAEDYAKETWIGLRAALSCIYGGAEFSLLPVLIAAIKQHNTKQVGGGSNVWARLN